MDVIQIIRTYLEQCEEDKRNAVAQYNKAVIAIETLKELTDLMLRETINDHSHSESVRTEDSIEEGT